MKLESEAIDFIRYTLTQDQVKGWWDYHPFIEEMKKNITIVDINEGFNDQHQHVITIDTKTINAESMIKESYKKHTDAYIKKSQEREQAYFDVSVELNKKGMPRRFKEMDAALEEMFNVIYSRWKCGIKEYAKKDYSMSACYWSDAYDLFDLAKAYKDRNLNAASQMSFDTCVREMIPETIYRWMKQQGY